MAKNLYERALGIFRKNLPGENSFVVPVENVADSTAEDVAGLVTDFNGLLAKLKASGLMEADEEESEDPLEEDGGDSEAPPVPDEGDSNPER